MAGFISGNGCCPGTIGGGSGFGCGTSATFIFNVEAAGALSRRFKAPSIRWRICVRFTQYNSADSSVI